LEIHGDGNNLLYVNNLFYVKALRIRGGGWLNVCTTGGQCLLLKFRRPVQANADNVALPHFQQNNSRERFKC